MIDLGGKVLITGRKNETLKKVEEELRCKALEWDISDLKLAKTKVEEIVKIFDGRIDCFINNAGIYTNTLFCNCNIDQWKKVIDTNLSGLYFATKEIVTQCFEKLQNGNIIMIASIEGIRGNTGPYGISKSGVIHLTHSLAKDLLSKNIRVNAIAPGMTCSNINAIKDNDNVYRDFLKGKRVLSAKEIADIAVFLISDSSQCITGQIISCDNGETLI